MHKRISIFIEINTLFSDSWSFLLMRTWLIFWDNYSFYTFMYVYFYLLSPEDLSNLNYFSAVIWPHSKIWLNEVGFFHSIHLVKMCLIFKCHKYVSTFIYLSIISSKYTWNHQFQWIKYRVVQKKVYDVI